MAKASVNSRIKTWSWPWAFGTREVQLLSWEVTYGELGPRDLGWAESKYLDEFVADGCNLPSQLEVPAHVLKELKAAIAALPSDTMKIARAARLAAQDANRDYSPAEAEAWWDALMADVSK